MNTRMLILAVLLGAFSGCAGSPAHTVLLSPEDLKTTDVSVLTSAYGFEQVWWPKPKGHAKLRAEIERRGLFKPDQWSRIDSQSPIIGDNPDVVAACWGYGDTVNVRVTNAGRLSVVKYNLGYQKSAYVHYVNGQVAEVSYYNHD